MEKKIVEIYIDIEDNEMKSFSGPYDIHFAVVHFVDNKKIVFSKKLKNKFSTDDKEESAEYIDSYQSPSPMCKGGDCD